MKTLLLLLCLMPILVQAQTGTWLGILEITNNTCDITNDIADRGVRAEISKSGLFDRQIISNFLSHPFTLLPGDLGIMEGRLLRNKRRAFRVLGPVIEEDNCTSRLKYVWRKVGRRVARNVKRVQFISCTNLIDPCKIIHKGQLDKQ